MGNLADAAAKEARQGQQGQRRRGWQQRQGDEAAGRCHGKIALRVYDRRKHDLRDYEEIEVVTLQLPQPKKGYQWACEMGANSFKEYHRRVRWDAPYPLAQPAKKELKRGMSWEEARKRSVEPEWRDARLIAAQHAREKAVALRGSLKRPVDVESDSD